MSNYAAALRRSARTYKIILSATTILCCGQALSAFGQTTTTPVRTLPDSRNVDLASGWLTFKITDLSAGSGATTFSHDQTWAVGGGLVDDFSIGLIDFRGVFLNGPNAPIWITRSGQARTFTPGTNGFVSDQGDGATLTESADGFVYTTADGTVITFKKSADPRPLVASSIKKPDGDTITIAIETQAFTIPGLPSSYASRIVSVTSTTGYRIDYEYESDETGDVRLQVAWGGLKRISLKNTAKPEAGEVAAASYQSAAGAAPQSTVATMVDAAGRKTSYDINDQGQITAITRPGSTAPDVTFTYAGQLSETKVASVTDAGGTTTYSYADDASGRTVTVTGPNNDTTRYLFNLSNQTLLSTTDPTGHVTTSEYDAQGRPTKTTQASGNVTQNTYDAKGNITETRIAAKPGSGVADVAATASFPCTSSATCAKPEWTRDAKGNQTDFTYDAVTGNVTTVTAPADAAGVRAVTSYSYSDVGGVSLLSRVSTCLTASSCAGAASERVTTFGYDANGLPTTQSSQSGDGSVVVTTIATYDAIGNRVTVDGPLPGAEDTAYFRYDAARQLVGVISPDPDGAGALLRRAVRNTYDARGRVILTEQGNVGEVSEAGWAAFAPLQQTARNYDGLDRPLSETVSGGGTVYSVTQSSYVGNWLDCTAVRLNNGEWGTLPASACAAQTETSAGPDRISKYGYDASGRITQQTSAFGTSVAATEATAYTPNGQTASLTDANGNVTAYTYDGLNQLATTTFPGGSIEMLSHDANGNVTSRVLRDGNTIAYGYDALNRVVSATVPRADTREFDRTYTYDLAGDLIRAAGSDGQYANLGYDALGRQISETSSASTRQFRYDAAGRRTRLAWADGAFVSYEYLVTGEVSAIRENGDPVLAGYGYDNLGRRTTLTRGNGVATSYAYDPASRLTSLTENLAGDANDLTISFTYNNAGQIVTRTASNPAYAWTGAIATNRSYTANARNQYTQAGDVTFGYDARGNLTTSGATAFGYTSENRLSTGPGGYLAYDPLGRLSDENGQLTLQYDGSNLTTEQVGGAIARRYVFAPGDDEAIIWYEGVGLTDKRWLVADERGSIIAVTDAAGNATTINRYDEYGIPASTNTGRFQYTGQKWLPGFGLYDYKARIYSPTLGRFMQTDPSGYEDGGNLYNYVGGDAVNNTDPTGLSGCPVSSGDEVVVCAAKPEKSPGVSIDPLPLIRAIGKVGKSFYCKVLGGFLGGCGKKKEIVISPIKSILPPGGYMRPALGPNPLDPQFRNGPLTPYELTRITNTQNLLANGSTAQVMSTLKPHYYSNVPDPITGAMLPYDSMGYTSIDLLDYGRGSGNRLLFSNTPPSQTYYTNTHYKSFYWIGH